MSEENIAIVRRVLEAFARQDVDAQLAMFDPDVELHEWPEGPDPGTYRGHAGALRAYQSWYEAWEWVRSEPTEFVDFDDRVLVIGRTRAKGRGSALEVVLDAFDIYTLGDGKVTRIEFFTDREAALTAAGLSHERIQEEAK
jgi:ketosteroid isomerase-like protein